MNILGMENKMVMKVLAILTLLLLPEFLDAQIRPNWQIMTRGKFWGTMNDAGGEVTGGGGPIGITHAYPGSYGSPNQVFGGLPIDALLIKTPEARILNEPWDLTPWESSFPHMLVKNYNFGLSMTDPEEWSYGRCHSYDSDPNDTRFPILYEKAYYRACWSLPEYDDFIITVMVVKNIDTRPWIDAYFSNWKPINMTTGGSSKFGNDQEYVWESSLETLGSENGAFVFYDENSWPGFGTVSASYSISPGDVTGDKGDPGNIKEQNSIDSKLYSPQAIAEAWIDCTPNKNGEKKFWYEIRNSGTGTWMNGVMPMPLRKKP